MNYVHPCRIFQFEHEYDATSNIPAQKGSLTVQKELTPGYDISMEDSRSPEPWRYKTGTYRRRSSVANRPLNLQLQFLPS